MSSLRTFDRLNSIVKFQDPNNVNKTVTFDVSSVTTDRTIIIPDANTTLVGIAVTQTLTNKTIDADLNTITNIDNADIKAGAAIDATKIADGSVNNTEFQYLANVGSAVVGISDTQTLTNKTLTDSSTWFQDNGDTTKKLQFQLSSISTATTRTLIIPDADTTIVGTDATQTLTNKTINADQNTITNIDNADIKSGAAIDATKIADGSVNNTEFQYLANVGSAVVGISDTQTLTNKTLIDSTTYFADNGDNTKIMQFQLSGITTATTRTLTVPNEDTTLVGTGATQTLTNKTFGNNLNMSSNKIVNLADPTADQDAATKAYVDGVASGLTVKQSVVAASTVDLNSNSSISGSITYNATGGSSARGQITAALAVSNTFTVDGINFSSSENGARILLKDQSSGAQNGIWTTTITGTSLTLNRATDYDEDDEVNSGAFCFVEQGTVNADSGWVLTTENPITIGGASGTALAFSQFSGAGQIIAGTGMTKTGNTLNVGGSTTIIANADTLEVNSSNTANQVLLSSGTAGSASTYGALPLNNTNAVTGVLNIPNGGTNSSSFTAGDRLIQTNSGNTALVATSIDPVDIELKKKSTVTTTNATQTTVATIATSTDTTYLIDIDVVGRNTAANESYAMVIRALFRNNGGTLVLIGDDYLEVKDNSLHWDATATTSGTNILVRVTGEASTNINWKCSYSLVTV